MRRDLGHPSGAAAHLKPVNIFFQVVKAVS